MVKLLKKIRTLGQGSYGTVELWSGVSGQYAVKIIPISSGTTAERVVREAIVSMYLTPKCSKFFLCFEDFKWQGDSAVIITNFIPGSYTLNAFLSQNTLTPLQTLFVMQNLAAGMMAMHDMGVVSRDVKMDNILFIPRQGLKCKYIDYGLACMDVNAFMEIAAMLEIENKLADVPQDLLQETIEKCPEGAVGSPYYMAPEIIRQEQKTIEDLFPSDVWSLGIVFYYLFTGKFMVTGDNPMALLYRLGSMNSDLNILEEPYRPTNLESTILELASTIINPMLRVARNRATAREVFVTISNILITLGQAPGVKGRTRDDMIVNVKVNPKTPYMLNENNSMNKTIQLLLPSHGGYKTPPRLVPVTPPGKPPYRARHKKYGM